ncbi:MAG TPA: CoA transferase [Rhizomicrobium sp.]|jgi:formyl-CoA transferase|nr:CoA transferase [Rhizomicrobium sp.]
MADGLFSDLLVIDCASFIAGPAAATILSDFGARVIKVEPPEIGDSYRQFRHMPGVPACEHDFGWLLDNRNKESLALDLKAPDGRRIFEALVKKADVFVTNFPGPVRRKLKLNAPDLMPLNDKLIYASITPYGEEGPDADRTGYDTTAWWARSGLMDHVRATPDTPPGFSVPGMGDHPTATSLYAGIVSALYRRTKTGKGSHVQTSLLANGLWSNGVLTQAMLCGADLMAPRQRSALAGLYRASCGRWFMLVIINDTRDWPRLIATIDRPDLLNDPRFSTSEARKANLVELQTTLHAVMETADWPTWLERFNKAGLPVGIVNRTVDHTDDVQVEENKFFRHIEGSFMQTIDSPVRIDGVEKTAPRMAPEIGEHSKAILNEFGFGAEADRLIESGVVGA